MTLFLQVKAQIGDRTCRERYGNGVAGLKASPTVEKASSKVELTFRSAHSYQKMRSFEIAAPSSARERMPSLR